MAKDPELLCEHRGSKHRGPKDTVVCPGCDAYLSKKTYHRHKKNCTKKSNNIAVPISLTMNINENDSFFTDVLSRLHHDDIGQLCRQEELVQLYDRYLYRKAQMKGSKMTDARKTAKRDMRQLATLYQHFNAAANEESINVNSCYDMLFDRSNYDFLESAVIRMATSENSSQQKDSVKVHLGYLIKNVCHVLKGTYLTKKEDDKATEISNFEAVMKLKWSNVFGVAEYNLNFRRQNELRKPGNLPTEEDMDKIKVYTNHRLDELSQHPIEVKRYPEVRSIVISRLTIFNARRGGEPARLTLKQWEDAKTGSWLDQSAIGRLDDNDKNILQNFKICYQAEKGIKHVVPVIIPKDTVSALNFLADQRIRLQYGILPSNYFVFATKGSDDHASGWHAVKEVCIAAGVKGHVNATGVRHRASTVHASLQLPNKENRYFYSHMGHSENMNKDVYQCPLAVAELTKMGRYFKWLDDGQHIAINKPGTSYLLLF